MMNPTRTRPSQREIIEIAGELGDRFAERAAAHDADGSFPYENYADVRAAGYPALTVPEALGGWGAGLYDAVLAQERLAMGDGSTALAVTMHIQTIGNAANGEAWQPQLFETLCADVLGRGALVNSCATEPELGSPSRGGKPATKAVRDSDGWRITGRKSFASMSPVLDYFIIPAVLDDSDIIGRFLVPRQVGIEIVETWDSLGMRGTGSHDVTLSNVLVPSANLISQAAVSASDPTKIRLNPWFILLTSAVYLGVAAAGHKTALDFAHERVPTALGKPISTLESIQGRLGAGELALQTARAVLYRAAEDWDRRPRERDGMGAAILVAKMTTTNAAIQIVDHAMRVVGGASMTHQLPLERYYRDVRAGLFHPPSDDAALPMLGRAALTQSQPGTKN